MSRNRMQEAGLQIVLYKSFFFQCKLYHVKGGRGSRIVAETAEAARGNENSCAPMHARMFLMHRRAT